MRDEARSLGVLGWCRNLPDGRVEAIVQGPKKQVEIMTDWAHHGPDAAVVDHVEVKEAPGSEEPLEEFEIRR
jgi:acylphosphatase